MSKIEILGVKVDALNMASIMANVKALLEDGQQHYFCTPNPEIILAALKDAEYKAILNNADIQTADGAGLLWASEFLHEKNLHDKKRRKTSTALMKIFTPTKCKSIIPERVTGVDLTKQICKLAEALNKKVFLLGANEGVAQKTKENLNSIYPQLKIVGTFSGSPKPSDEAKIIEMINSSGAEILFVAYGAPAQEKWIARNLVKMPTVRLAGGVGGTFDFIAGTKKRAPKWMQNIGVEWLYRLIIQPSRIKRIFNATIKFPFVVLRSK